MRIANSITRLAGTLATAALLLIAAMPCAAQKFSVVSVSKQANDVSAFIKPIRDNNGDACALLKVEAPVEFAFSTPLGIVKRVEEVGEIWLYLPSGTTQITLKHPQWGVLRNYRLPSALESHVCYIMKIKSPQPEITEIHDTITFTKTLRDTITVKYKRPSQPWSSYVMATAAMHEGGPSFGLFAATMKWHGLFLHASSNLKGIGKTELEVNSEGYADGSNVMPFYNGEKRQTNFILTAGLIHRICKNINIFEGAGYGKTSTAWQLDQTEGGGWALCRDYNHKGVATEAGLMWHDGKWAVLMSASNIKFRQWQMNIGIGIRIGKK